jgi:hypothetical protein
MDVAELDRQPSLAAAVVRFDELRTREAGYGRQLTVRTARATGASWAEIGTSLGTTRQSAWEGHRRWIDGQEAQHGSIGDIGFDAADAAAARAPAGSPEER